MRQRPPGVPAACLLVLLLAAGAPPCARSEVETRLVLIGGGVRPKDAVTRFVSWAGGKDARLLVVPWASGEPLASCEEAIQDLRTAEPAEVACAPAPHPDARGRVHPLDADGSSTFLDQLGRATGVFFTGGDQGRILDVLADLTLVSALQARYASGVVFGGTSAGTAVMSPLVITGDGDLTVIDGDKVAVRPGLGLLQGVILDQHFVKRQRANRLFGLVLKHSAERGVGIDEGTALLVTHGRYGEVVGSGLVVIVDAMSDDRLEVTLRRRGQKVNLRRLF